MRKSAFTIMEILLAMAIIGILAAVSVNSMGKMSANKVKTGFQNCYRHTIETVNSIVSDETKFPVITQNSATYDETGHSKVMPLCKMYEMNESTGVTSSNQYLFPLIFKDATTAVSATSLSNGWKFTTKNGSFWLVKYQKCSTSGTEEGTNCPYDYKNSDDPSGSNCKYPDTFKFGLTYENKLLPDENKYYNGKTLADYMEFAGFGSN